MSRIISFVKSTAIGGLLVIVPIAIILFVLGGLFNALYSLSNSLLTDLGLQIDDALIMVGIAAVSFVAICFLTGLVVQTRLGVALRDWLKNNVARRIPMYNAISSLTKRFAGLEGNNFAPVEVDIYDSSARAVGFLVEQLPNDRCAVFIPAAPVATMGNIYVVPQDKVHRLDASVSETLTAISQWGVDTQDLYISKSKNNA
jgi:uncharacterized membrane protein